LKGLHSYCIILGFFWYLDAYMKGPASRVTAISTGDSISRRETEGTLSTKAFSPSVESADTKQPTPLSATALPVIAITHHDMLRVKGIKRFASQNGNPTLLLKFTRAETFEVLDCSIEFARDLARLFLGDKYMVPDGGLINFIKENASSFNFFCSGKLRAFLVVYGYSTGLTAFIEGNLGDIGGDSMSDKAKELTKLLAPERVAYFSGTEACLRDCDAFCDEADPLLPSAVRQYAVLRNILNVKPQLIENRGWSDNVKYSLMADDIPPTLSLVEDEELDALEASQSPFSPVAPLVPPRMQTMDRRTDITSRHSTNKRSIDYATGSSSSDNKAVLKPEGREPRRDLLARLRLCFFCCRSMPKPSQVIPVTDDAYFVPAPPDRRR
jgi:hypothetical protein